MIGDRKNTETENDHVDGLIEEISVRKYLKRGQSGLKKKKSRERERDSNPNTARSI